MCLIVSAQYLLNCLIICYQIWYVVYYHEVMCLAEKLVHFLQCQGHSKGLYKQNLTIFTISYKLLVLLQPNLL